MGEPALIPSAEQTRAIAQASHDDAPVKIGTSPLAGDVDVRVHPDRLFGRHLAVLGNTGSGKSCTVAGLIRWSLESAVDNLEKGTSANARFIVLDPNGEYAECFSDLGDVRVFRPSPSGPTEKQLTVPAWMWNSSEWSAIARASMQTQRPLLQRALRDLKSQIALEEAESGYLRVQMLGFASLWQSFVSSPDSYTSFPKFKAVKTTLENIAALCVFDAAGWAAENADLLTVVQAVLGKHNGQYENAFATTDMHSVQAALAEVCSSYDAELQHAGSEDAPRSFDLNVLGSHITALSQTGDFAAAAGHASFLVARIRTLLSDPRIRQVIDPEVASGLVAWITGVLGEADGSSGPVAVIDLSLVAAEVVHTVVAVLSRIVMEALQYVRRATGTEFPTVLVLEEAHNFVAATASESESPTAADLCRTTFERIAREGRKFGLGLVLSSQRPSALSATVLSQCNTFLLHRLVNDRDQDLVSRLVPDALGSILSELPSLPSRQAILLGWATAIPTLVEVAELGVSQRPHSDDPSFWNVWRRATDIDFTWDEVLSPWMEGS